MFTATSSAASLLRRMPNLARSRSWSPWGGIFSIGIGRGSNDGGRLLLIEAPSWSRHSKLSQVLISIGYHWAVWAAMYDKWLTVSCGCIVVGLESLVLLALLSGSGWTGGGGGGGSFFGGMRWLIRLSLSLGHLTAPFLSTASQSLCGSLEIAFIDSVKMKGIAVSESGSSWMYSRVSTESHVGLPFSRAALGDARRGQWKGTWLPSCGPVEQGQEALSVLPM